MLIMKLQYEIAEIQMDGSSKIQYSLINIQQRGTRLRRNRYIFL